MRRWIPVVLFLKPRTEIEFLRFTRWMSRNQIRRYKSSVLPLGNFPTGDLAGGEVSHNLRKEFAEKRSVENETATTTVAKPYKTKNNYNYIYNTQLLQLELLQIQLQVQLLQVKLQQQNIHYR